MTSLRRRRRVLGHVGDLLERIELLRHVVLDHAMRGEPQPGGEHEQAVVARELLPGGGFTVVRPQVMHQRHRQRERGGAVRARKAANIELLRV